MRHTVFFACEVNQGVILFSCEFCEISKNTFFTEHLWATASRFMDNALSTDSESYYRRLIASPIMDNFIVHWLIESTLKCSASFYQFVY